MKLSQVLAYYEEYIDELLEDLDDGVLDEDSIVQACVKDGFVVDWYYDHQTTMADLNPKNAAESGLSFAAAKSQYDHYKADMPYLKQLTVKELLQVLTDFIDYYSPKNN